MTQIDIGRIEVGDRLREELGDIDGLAGSIRKYGLLHPIVIDDRGRLVAGQRRLEACKKLGMKRVEVRKYGELSPAERRELELEENLHRKDLTAFEKSKVTEDLAEAAEEVFGDSPKTPKVADAVAVSSDVPKSRGGRPRKDAVPQEEIAERVGLSVRTIQDARKHVEVAERYPFLQGPDWSQKRALEVGALLDDLPAVDRRRAVSLVEESSAPASEAQKMIASFARATPEVRERVYAMARSGDERDRSLAITHLSRNAPEPDPRSVWAATVASEAKRQARRFPDDPMNVHLLAFSAEAERLSGILASHHAARTAALRDPIVPAEGGSVEPGSAASA